MEVQNNEETTQPPKKLGGATGKGWLPGQSGNPGGRPPNSMKDYLKRKFSLMSDEEKEDWLESHEVSGDTQLRMGEGNPHSTNDVKVELPPIPIDDVKK